MQFWLPALILAAIVMFALAGVTAWLSSRANTGEGGLAVLKHQLAELDADVAAQRIDAAESEGLRNELSRRILAAARQEKSPVGHSANGKFAFLTALVPLAAVAIYLQIGQPTMPDAPRAERLANAQKNKDTEAMVAQVEDHLAQKPDDVEGWKLLAPIYMDMGRFADAAGAQLQIMALTGETADLKAGVAEALTLRDQGMMPEAAIAAAMEAYALNSKNPKAQFYRALALSQQGKKAESEAAFKLLLANSPPDAPWRGAVEAQLKRFSGAAPSLAPGQAEAVASMSPEEQKAMIRSMVEGLDQRLASNGDDIEGWLRLIRARSVLGEMEKATMALAKARGLFGQKPTELAALNDLAKELKLP